MNIVEIDAKAKGVAIGQEHRAWLAKDTLARLADIDKCFWGHVWHIGKNLTMARTYFNNNKTYHDWRMDILSGLPQKTAQRYCALWEAFGGVQNEVKRISKTDLYELAAPKYKDNRRAIITTLNERMELDEDSYWPQSKLVKGEVVQEVIDSYFAEKVAEEAAPQPTTESASEPVATTEVSNEAEVVDEVVVEPDVSEPVTATEAAPEASSEATTESPVTPHTPAQEQPEGVMTYPLNDDHILVLWKAMNIFQGGASEDDICLINEIKNILGKPQEKGDNNV